MNKFKQFLFGTWVIVTMTVISLLPGILVVIFSNPWLLFLYFVIPIPFFGALIIFGALSEIWT